MSNDPSTHTQHDGDTVAQRSTQVLQHLDGVLEDTMLAAMQGVWSTLERAATSPEAHARAVRERMFWDSLTPETAQIEDLAA